MSLTEPRTAPPPRRAPPPLRAPQIGRGAGALRRLRSRGRPALAVPCLLALGYLVLLVVRYPHLIAWQNADSDVAASYTLTAAIAGGHTGQVELSTQGNWLEMGWLLLTHGLPDYRLWWELLAPALGALTLGVLGWSVRRVAGTGAALLAVALLLAASPTALMNLVSTGWHNTSTLGAACLGALLVWLRIRPRSRRSLVAAGLLATLAGGVCLASDHLFMVIGLIPFALTGGLAGARRERLVVAAVIVGSGVEAVLVSAIMRALDFRVNSPGLAPASPHAMAVHLGWLGAGLLRLGNGLSVAPHGPWLTPLILASAVASVAGLGALVALAVRARRSLRRAPGASAARAAHVIFWTSSALCAALAYVVTNAAYQASDRYIFIVVPAVAATVPLLSRAGGRARTLLAAGAAVYVAASLVSLASGAIHHRAVIIDGRDVAETARIERAVAARHLTVGYAGYWDASNLEWSSHERLHVYPLLGDARTAAPMFDVRVAAWYRVRPDTPSYLVLAPGDATFPDRLPAALPRPAEVVHLGRVTLDVWPYDIARDLGPSQIPLP